MSNDQRAQCAIGRLPLPQECPLCGAGRSIDRVMSCRYPDKIDDALGLRHEPF